MKRYQNIFFDLDGTLTDSAEGVTKSVQYALKKYGIEASLDELRSFIGPPLQRSFKEVYGFGETGIEEVIGFYREYYREKGIYENQVYSFVPEILEALKKNKLALFVATSKPTIFAEKILNHFGLRDYFISVVGSNLDGTRVEKAEVIEHILNKTARLKKSETVMVGDRKHDINGARTCNLDSVAVTYGYGSPDELKAANPTHIVHSVKDLGELLLS